MAYRNLCELQRRAPAAVLEGLRSPRPNESREAGLALVKTAAEFGLGVRDYLTLAIDPRLGEDASSKMSAASGLNGYETALVALNLPFRTDMENGILLQAASETFNTYPGTRAMFPEVIDDMVRWKGRQDGIEQLAPLLAQSRTISGVEMLSTVVEDDAAERDTFTVPELARIPVRTLRTSEQAVRFYKHGSALRTSYEFARRASLELLTPFANRIARELEISKVKMATAVLINGDGVNAPAGTVGITGYGGTAGTLDYKSLAKWMMARAKAGLPLDTIVGNYDIFVEMLMLFTPNLSSDKNLAREMVSQMRTPSINVDLPVLNGSATFVLSSGMPEGKLMGYSKGDTLEELKEVGSDIAESEKSILNQSITYVRTENSGFKLAFGDTRQMLDIAV
jgi:hypothetical protein